MIIRRAQIRDMEDINRLLFQVAEVHHKGRPDLFKGNAKKYNDEELAEIIADDQRPIFVAVNDEDTRVTGYAFCVFRENPAGGVLTEIKTLYIDDLCVDETLRGQHIGSRLYEYVKKYAKEAGCYNVTLNVWTLNASAQKFYEACGMRPQKVGMETIL